MRRTAVIGTCIAAFALVTSALNTPNVVPPRTNTRPAAGKAAARALWQLSLANPPVSRHVRGRLAHVPRPAARAARASQTPAVTMRPAGDGTRTGHVPAPSGWARASAARATPTASAIHVVQSGDSLWTISRRHGVSVESLAAANGLSLTSILQLGQRLTVPTAGAAAAQGPAPRPARRAVATISHTVRPGDTLWAIARRYGTDVEDILALNDLSDSDRIKPGQRVLVSGASLPRHRQTAAQAASGRRPVMADAEAIRAAGAFLWPARGTLTSRFGWRYRRHHNGIDVASPTGTPIYAARDGVVEFSGWKGGYGRVVFVNHGAGVTTVYGHASRLLVGAGQRVKKGQLIAHVGCTGSCTGSHVHFEVRINDQAVDPMRYLGNAQARR